MENKNPANTGIGVLNVQKGTKDILIGGIFGRDFGDNLVQDLLVAVNESLGVRRDCFGRSLEDRRRLGRVAVVGNGHSGNRGRKGTSKDRSGLSTAEA